MTQPRDEICRCGSGLSYALCCDASSRRPESASPPIPYGGVLPLDSCCDRNSADRFEEVIFDRIRRGNLAQAEVLVRGRLEDDPDNSGALNFLGWIAAAASLPKSAHHYFSAAIAQSPHWELPAINLARVKACLDTGNCSGTPDEKFLLIKAWGFGFWSDVTHVLGQLLVAEVTGRTPVVHWGPNSRFGDGTDSDAFVFYFEPLSDRTIHDLRSQTLDYWPPKWNRDNLSAGEMAKWEGPYSRVASLWTLGRREKVVVSDFFTSLFELKPWIPAGSHLHGRSVDELMLYLVRKYLRPQREITDKVNAFYAAHLGSPEFIGVHARGSDKVAEVKSLGELNSRYKGAIDGFLSSHNCERIFLMTEDSRLLDYFVSLYGRNVIATDCQRTDDSRTFYIQPAANRRRLGEEVMVDAYLAARAAAFVGNGSSNPSQIVRYLKDWPAEHVTLIGPSMNHMPNTFLHRW